MRTVPLRAGFTLVELLVVIGTIAIMIGLLIPALTSVRRASQSAACLSNMRQIGIGLSMYTHDSHGWFPRSSHSALAHNVMPWGYALMPYFSRHHYAGPGPAWDKLFNSLYRCPADNRLDKYSYGKSVWFELTGPEIGELTGCADGPTYHRITNVKRSSATVMFAEVKSGAMADHVMAHFWHFGGAPEIDQLRHGKTSNYVFVDGHAEARPFNSTFDLSNQLDNWDPAKAK
jgi:prepilin-type processing-associated H-X9-DG protein